jgi:transposase
MAKQTRSVSSVRNAARKAERRKRAQKGVKQVLSLPILHADTAGIDMGATEIFVAVPVDRDADPVRCFGSFTEDLRQIAAWLKQCGIRRVAMESTGVYWIPLWQVLSDDKFEVCLVKARHFKNVPGKKTDVEDCQWLQFLHSVGLLRGSYRPEQAICGVRTLLQYRGELIRFAAEHIQHMQKALEQMNPLSRPTPNPRVSLSSASSAYRTTMLPWPSRRRSTFWAVSSM